MDPIQENNISNILQRLAAYANGDQAPSYANPDHQIMPYQIPQMINTLASPEQTGNLSGIDLDSSNPHIFNLNDDTRTRNAHLQDPETQKTSGVEYHLERLQQITAAAKASQKQGTQSKPQSAPGYIDPSDHTVILHWAPALRHVSRLGGPGSDLEVAIRKLIKSQQDNELSWWQGREDLRMSTTSTGQNNKDLDAYDTKVYKAQQDMYAHMEVQLRDLGIPFFGLDPDRVLTNGNESQDGKISKGELQKLQRRMLEYLEDMYAP
jgi:Protein of unknown function (DUF2458)